MYTTEHASLRLIGSSPTMRGLDGDIETAARSHAKVLITGETGVGKEVVARLIHQRSSAQPRARWPRSTAPAFRDTLLESELFGHVRGSFTGAYRDKLGAVRAGAHSGTVFLDEVGEMSLRMQAMLLRFLETGEMQRVGADQAPNRGRRARHRRHQPRPASSAIADRAVPRGSLLPAERHPHATCRRCASGARTSRCCWSTSSSSSSRQHQRRPAGVSRRRRWTLLEAYRWPGNVRELKNVVERLVVRARTGEASSAAICREECCAPARDHDRSVVGPPTPAGVPPAMLFERMVDGGESFWSAVTRRSSTRPDARRTARGRAQGGWSGRRATTAWSWSCSTCRRPTTSASCRSCASTIATFRFRRFACRRAADSACGHAATEERRR